MWTFLGHGDWSVDTSVITQFEIITLTVPHRLSHCHFWTLTVGWTLLGGHKGWAVDVSVVKHWDVDTARVKPTGPIWGHKDKGRTCLWSHALKCRHPSAHLVRDVDACGIMQTGVQLLLG